VPSDVKDLEAVSKTGPVFYDLKKLSQGWVPSGRVMFTGT
jgi:hypothetical protein